MAPPLALRLSGVGLVLPPNWPRPRIWATLPAVEALHDHTASRPHSRQNGPACRWPGNPIDPSAPGSGNDPQDLDQAGAPELAAVGSIAPGTARQRPTPSWTILARWELYRPGSKPSARVTASQGGNFKNLAIKTGIALDVSGIIAENRWTPTGPA